MKALRQLIPWHVRILSKIVLSRVPVGYRFWSRLKLFRHGEMDRPSYALAVFRHHVEQSGFGSPAGYVALELGPGDSLFSAILVAATGGSRCWLVDVGPFADERPEPYLAMADLLKSEGLQPADLQGSKDISDILSRCNARYETRGLTSLREIPDRSVDFIWSHAVLEHIRRRDFLPIMSELRRLIRPGGVCSFRVDLQDHLGGSLNNLRFSERVWESEWMSSSGFYTNRIRFSEMLRHFETAGFRAEVIGEERWERVPLARSKMAREFAELSDQELAVFAFDVVLRPA